MEKLIIFLIFLKGVFSMVVTTERKNKGSEILIVTLFTFLLVALIGYSISKLQGATFASLNSSEATMQAQHHAKTKMEYLIYKGYNNLASQAKTVITGSSFKDSVSLGVVTTDSDGLSRRLVTVSVYKGDEIRPRATLEQVFYSNDANLLIRNENSPADNLSFSYSGNKLHLKVNGEEKKIADGVPVGTIIAWPGNSAPTEGGTWLLCNGQSCASYPALVAVVGNNVPNLNARFLEGTSGTAGFYRSAGLPNITGTFELWKFNNWLSGAFYTVSAPGGANTKNGGGDPAWQIGFDASRMNGIYGASSTVQPASFVVRYYIKAA